MCWLVYIQVALQQQLENHFTQQNESYTVQHVLNASIYLFACIQI